MGGCGVGRDGLYAERESSEMVKWEVGGCWDGLLVSGTFEGWLTIKRLPAGGSLTPTVCLIV